MVGMRLELTKKTNKNLRIYMACSEISGKQTAINIILEDMKLLEEEVNHG